LENRVLLEKEKENDMENKWFLFDFGLRQILK
jgi:hypothetical protein